MPMVPFLSPSMPPDRPRVMGPVAVAGVIVAVAGRFPLQPGKVKPAQQDNNPVAPACCRISWS